MSLLAPIAGAGQLAGIDHSADRANERSDLVNAQTGAGVPVAVDQDEPAVGSEHVHPTTYRGTTVGA